MHIFSPKKEAIVIVLTMILSAGIFAVTGYASAQHADQPDSNQLLAQQNTNDFDPPACMDGVDNDDNDDPDYADPECCEGSMDSEESGDCGNCNDGSDNDDDGLTDLDDPMCEAASDTESPKNTVPVEDNDYISVNASDNSPPSHKERNQIGDDKDNWSSANSDTIGFEQQLSGNASVTFSQGVFGNWLVAWKDRDRDDGVDPEEYGTIDTTVTFYDKNDTKVAEWELDGAAGYSSEGNDLQDRVGGKDYYLDDGSFEERQISHTFQDVGGAVYMTVRNFTYSQDDLEDKGWFDESDDYTTDTYVNTLVGNVSLDVPDDDNPQNPPVALDDGNNDLPICSSFDPIDINVLDNDGGDSISIDSVSNPSNGTATTTSKNGTDWIRYTPSSKPDTVTFEYTISDVDENTDTAEVTVNVTDACGDITVEFEDPEGNPVEVDSANVEYNDDPEACSGSGTSVSCNVELFDDGADAVIQKSYIDKPEGYDFADRWIKKDPDAPDNYPNTPNRSELGF